MRIKTDHCIKYVQIEIQQYGNCWHPISTSEIAKAQKKELQVTRGMDIVYGFW